MTDTNPHDEDYWRRNALEKLLHAATSYRLNVYSAEELKIFEDRARKVLARWGHITTPTPMTENANEKANDQPTLVSPIGASDYTINAPRITKPIPDAYREVRFCSEDGQVHLKLQGYFSWTQGWFERGGEWRDIETVDADDLSDDKPYGHLY